MKIEILRRHEGFTLLEIIVTLIIVSIMGAMLISMTSGALTRSTQPAIQTMEINVMNQVADGISRAYRELGSISDLQAHISAGDYDLTDPAISVTASYTGYGNGTTPVEGGSSDLLRVTITGASGLTYSLLFGDIEI